MTKNELKLVAKIYAANMLIQQDTGYMADEVGLTEEESSFMGAYLNKIGEKMLGYHPEQSNLKSIIEYVYDLYYEKSH